MARPSYLRCGTPDSRRRRTRGRSCVLSAQRPAVHRLENGFFFLIRSKLYLWNNVHKKSAAAPATVVALAGSRADVYVPKLSESKLHELSWSLDIKERIAAGVATEDERQVIRTRENIVAPIRTAKDVVNN